jgi:hypothetical protein
MKYESDFLEEFAKDIVETRIYELYDRLEKISQPGYELMSETLPDKILDEIDLLENIKSANSLQFVQDFSIVNEETKIFYKHIDSLLQHPKKEFMIDIECEYGFKWKEFQEIMLHLKKCQLIIT